MADDGQVSGSGRLIARPLSGRAGYARTARAMTAAPSLAAILAADVASAFAFAGSSCALPARPASDRVAAGHAALRVTQ
jgi:hypothetical protein